MASKIRYKEAKATGEPGWTWRKSVLFPAMLFSCWRLVMLEGQPDTMLNQIMATGHMWLLFGELAVFTGFATIQDVTAVWVTRSGLPYSKPPVEVVDEGQTVQPVSVDPNLKGNGL